MTARQVYEYMLIELNKVAAPSLLLEDFNYFITKAIYQYINKKYNIFETSQQLTDDLRVLKYTAELEPIKDKEGKGPKNSAPYTGVDVFELPQDYLHILNCICDFKMLDKVGCFNTDEDVQYSARKMTSDQWACIMQNYYMRPTFKNPYFFIHNTNTQSDKLPTDLYSSQDGTYDEEILPKTIVIGGTKVSTVKRVGTVRYGNSEPVTMEIRYGKNPKVKLNKIYVDYLKTPQHINLTQEQLDLVEDTSQVLEFPDYVCYEIVNELVKLLMENASDPRLQTNLPINQTIASPVQQGQK